MRRTAPQYLCNPAPYSDKEVSYVPKQTMHQVNSFDCPNVSFDYTPIRNQKRSGAWAGSSQDEHEGGIRECSIVLEDISRSQQGDFQTQEMNEIDLINLIMK